MDLKFKDNSQLRLAAFTQLEYIESTGTQYIDTGIKPLANDEFEISYMITGTTGTYNSIFGTRVSSSSNAFMFGYTSSGSYVEIGNQNISTFNKGYSQNVKHTIKLENGNLFVDGVLDRNITINQNTVHNLLLFTLNGNGTPTEFGKCRIYNFTIKRAGVKVLDLIPIKKLNGVVCFYDTISETFFYNQGTGDFVAGPLVNQGLPDTILLKVTTLYHKNTPNVYGIQLLNMIFNAQKTAGDVVLNRIRVDIGNVSGSLSELMRYASMAGFNDNYEPQAKPRLVGTYTINDWYTQEQLAEAQAAFDGLTIVPDPNYVIDFSQLAVQTLDSTQPNYNQAAAVVLQKMGHGVTLPEPLFEDEGRWFITYTQAAAITSIGFRNYNMIDANNIASTSYVAPSYLDFPELKYFGVDSVNAEYSGYVRTLWFPNNNCTYNAHEMFTNCIFYTYGTKLTIGVMRRVLSELHYYGTWDEWASRDYPSPYVYRAISNHAHGCSNVYFNDVRVSIATLSSSITKIGNNAFNSFTALSAVHIEALTPPTLGTAAFSGTSFKLYVGDGSSAEHDDAILADYLADTNWATYSSRLDTWYNYLHPNA